jgi:hypothetical protein
MTDLPPEDGRLDQHDLLGCTAITWHDGTGGQGQRLHFSLSVNTTPSVDLLALMCDDLATRAEQLCGVKSDPISQRPEIHGALVGCGHPRTRTRGGERGVKLTEKAS